MKLHLPSAIRKALMACMVAVTAQAAHATLGAGSMVGAGVLLSLVQQAQAAAAGEEDTHAEAPPMVYWNGDATWDASDTTTTEWTDEQGEASYAYVPGNSVTFGESGVHAITVAGAVQVQDMCITHADYTFAAGANAALGVLGNLTVSAAAKIAVDTTVSNDATFTAAVTLDNGKTFTINGDLAAANLTLNNKTANSGAWNANGAANLVLARGGAISGTFTVRHSNIQLGGDLTIGKVFLNGQMHFSAYNGASGVTVTINEIDMQNVQNFLNRTVSFTGVDAVFNCAVGRSNMLLTGTFTFSRNATFNGELFIGEGADVTLSVANRMVAARGFTLSKGGKLTAGTLDVTGSIVLSKGTLTVNQGLSVSESIRVGLTESCVIALGESFSFGAEKLSLAFEYGELLGIGVSGYSLFTGWQSEWNWQDYLELNVINGDLGEAYLEITAEGKLMIVSANDGEILQWASGNDGTWSARDSHEDWLTSDGSSIAYTEDINDGSRSVRFSTATAGSVALDGALSVKDMTVAGDYTFTGEGTLEMEGDLSIGAGTTILSGVEVTVGGELAATGTLKIAGGARLTLHGGGTAATLSMDANADNTIILGGDLMVNYLYSAGTADAVCLTFNREAGAEEVVTVTVARGINTIDDSFTFGEGVEAVFRWMPNALLAGASITTAENLTLEGEAALKVGAGTVTVGKSLVSAAALTVDNGSLTVGKNLEVSAGVTVGNGTVSIGGEAQVSSLSQNANTTGEITIGGDLRVSGTLAANGGSLKVGGTITAGTVNVDGGALWLNHDLTVSSLGAGTFNHWVGVEDDDEPEAVTVTITAYNNAYSKNMSFGEHVNASFGAFTATAYTGVFTAAGNVNFGGAVNIDTGSMEIAGNLTISPGSLSVSGNNGRITVGGSVSVSGTATISAGAFSITAHENEEGVADNSASFTGALIVGAATAGTASFTTGEGVNVQIEDSLTVQNGATATIGGALHASDQAVTVSGEGSKLTLNKGGVIHSLTVDTEVETNGELTLDMLSGEGALTGSGVVALTTAAGSFAGTVECAFDYRGGAAGEYTLVSEYTGSLLKVSSGKLILAGDSNSSIAVAEGASLELHGSSTMSGSGSSLAGLVEVCSGATLHMIEAAEAVGTIALVEGSTLNLNDRQYAALTVSMNGGGTLQNASSFTGFIHVDDRGSSGIAFGVMNAEAVFTLRLQSGSYVQGLGASIGLTGASALTFELSGNQSAAEAFLRAGGDSLAVSKAAGFESLLLDATCVLDALGKDTQRTYRFYIFSTQVENILDIVSLNAATLLYLNMEDNADGSLTFSYKRAAEGNVYVSSESSGSGEPGSVLLNQYDSLDGYIGMVVNQETVVDLREDSLPAGSDGLVMRNVVVTEDGSLDIVGKNDAGARSLVTLQNTCTEDELSDYARENGLGDMAVDNSFTIASGVRVSSADLQIKHAAAETRFLLSSRTVMEGGLRIENGDLLMTSGQLELRGESDVETVKFNGVHSSLIVNQARAAVGSLLQESLATPDSCEGATPAEHVRLENAGELVLKSGAVVGDGLVIGNEDTYGGTVTVSDEAAISAQSRLTGVVLNLEGALYVRDGVAYAAPRSLPVGWSLAGLTGRGALSGRVDIDLAVAGDNHTYGGDMSGYAGTMTVLASEYEQIFANVKGGRGWNMVNSDGGRVTFDLKHGGYGLNRLTMGDLTLQSGSYTTLLLDFASVDDRRGLMVKDLTIAAGANVTVAQYEGTVSLEGADGEVLSLGVITAGGVKDIASGVNWTICGVRNARDLYVDANDDGSVTVKVRLDNSNRYLTAADNANSATGARMLWELGETQSYGGDLAAVDAALLDLAEQGTAASRARANRVLAAVAGSSLATVSQAVSADMERQLRALRNRTTALVYNAPGDSTLNMSVWLNAESNYYKQSADGYQPGVKLSGWGGTVGMHLNQDDELTLGLALTAMYSDLTTEGADRLKGDLDTYYLGAIAQVAEGAWRHTFICSIGQAEVEGTRTVDYGSGSYRTRVSTSGMSFGAMYEVGYSVVLDETAAMCVQPVFNIAWRYTQMDAYRESGSSAALRVESQKQNTVTLGMGARLQAAVGESALNRVSYFEARALVKADLGDRRGEAAVALQSVNRPGGRVIGAERGVIGAELGAGITIPVGRQSDLFMDINAELRSSETNLNATLGYKVNF